MIQTDLQYLGLVSHQLEKFKSQGDNVFNFRCPLCGDSAKSKKKARGYIFPHKTDLFYKCHNCGYSSPFAELLKTINSELFKRYALEKFYNKQVKKEKEIVYNYESPVFDKKDNFISAISINKLNNDHEAKRYLKNRRIPYDYFYYTENFSEFTKEVKGKVSAFTDPRIIIPFLSSDGNLMGYQGRSLSSRGQRYVTEKLHADAPKIFGLDRVNIEETIYITEGPFDSLFVPNGIAMAGSDSNRWIKKFPKERIVMVLDNENRNKVIVKKYDKFISEGYKIFIWPEYIGEKDLNDLALRDLYDHTKILETINSNTFYGIGAAVKLSQWRKC
jgi:predicted RNA-binding Zn-ribbon protein involved in translation (DUF1610 family)